MTRVITGCRQSNHNRNEPSSSGNRQRKQSSSWKPYPGDRTEIRGKSMSWKRFRPEHDKRYQQQTISFEEYDTEIADEEASNG